MASISLFLLALLVVSCVVVGRRGRSQGVRTGGLSDIDVNDYDVQDIVKDLPSMTNKLDDMEIVKVVRAQRQVVSGFNYVLTIETRRKGTNGPATQKCKVSVWIQSWLNRRTLTSMKCKPVNAKDIRGHWSNVHITDTVRRGAKIVLDLMDRECNCMYGKSISEVKSVQKKRAAGILYKITVGIIDQDLPDVAEQECEITVNYKRWRYPKFSLVQYNCH